MKKDIYLSTCFFISNHFLQLSMSQLILSRIERVASVFIYSYCLLRREGLCFRVNNRTAYDIQAGFRLFFCILTYFGIEKINTYLSPPPIQIKFCTLKVEQKYLETFRRRLCFRALAKKGERKKGEGEEAAEKEEKTFQRFCLLINYSSEHALQSGLLQLSRPILISYPAYAD